MKHQLGRDLVEALIIDLRQVALMKAATAVVEAGHASVRLDTPRLGQVIVWIAETDFLNLCINRLNDSLVY
jgi:hypothetical protein